MEKKKDLTKEELLKQLEEVRQELAMSKIVQRQRNWTEQRLKESQERFKRLSELTKEGVVIHDGGVILDLNQVFADLFGYQMSECFGMNLFEKLIEAEALDKVHERMKDGFEGKYETVGVRKDGSIFPMEITTEITHQENKKVMVGIVRDITDVKCREGRFREINKCFLSFTSKPKDNINKLVALCGKLMGGDTSLYNYLDDDTLIMVGKWNAPEDLKVANSAKGHICYDVIKNTSDKVVYIPKLPESDYAKTDECVLKYGLQTYFGIAVKIRGQAIGALCVLYSRDFTPNEEDENLMQIIASAIGIEEERKRAYEARRQNIELYRSLVKTSPEGIFSYDVDGNIIMINKRAAEIFGLSNKEEAIGRNIFEFVSPQDRERSKNNLYKVMEEGSLLNKEYVLLRIDGTTFMGEVGSSVIKDVKGNITALIGTVRDVTQRKLAEEKIKKSQDLLIEAQKLVHIGNFEFTMEHQSIFWSEELYDILGYNPKYEPPTLDEFYRRIHSEDTEVLKTALDGAVKEGKSFDIEYRLNMPDGTLKYLHAVAKTESNSEGKLLRYAGTVQDITAQRIAEEKLKSSEEAHRILVENIPVCLGIADKHGKFTLWNKSFAEMTGYSAKDVIGKMTPYDMYLDKEESLEVMETVAQKGIYEGEVTLLTKDKKTVLAHVIIITKKDNTGKIIGYHEFAEDISKLKNVEKKIMFTKFVFDNMSEAALWVTSKGEISYVNASACRLLGYTRKELLKKTIHEIDVDFPKRSWDSRWQEMRRRKSAIAEARFKTKEGHIFPVEISGNYMDYENQEYLCALVRDITERERIEAVLRTAEKERTLILDSLCESVVYHDASMNIVWANKKARDLIGSISNRLVGYHCYQVWYKRKTPCKNCPVKKSLKSGNLEEGEILLPDGKCWNIRAYPVKDIKDKVIGVVEVSLDISERKNIEAQRTASVEKSRRILEETVVALAATAERRDPYTAGHQRRVSQLACAIAKEMGLPSDQIKGLRMAAIIHDVGKVYVPAEILSKPSRLSDLEFDIIKTHPQVGYEILKPVEFPWPVALIVLQHQERNNGSGYPRGLKDVDILLEAKVLTVADVVEAMASHRPYRAALGIGKALKEIQKNKGILYDIKAVAACTKLFKNKKFKFEK